MRDRGIPRRHGWIGGVCAGLAARMGVDPLVVRGIFVVAAVLGFPALFIYVIAWALMPDEDGRIHLEQLFRGRFDPAMIAIGIGLLLSLVPAGPWALGLLSPFGEGYLGGGPWYSLPFGGPVSGIGIVVGLIFVGLLVWLIVWAARNTSARRGFAAQMDASTPGSGSGEAASTSADPWAASAQGPWAVPAREGSSSPQDAPAAYSAGPDFAYAPVPSAGAAVEFAPPADGALAQAEAASAPTDTSDETAPPTPPAATTLPPTDVDQWREQQREWRGQHDAWRRQQADADRVVRDQLRAERAAANAVFAAESNRRRAERRAANPRASGAFVLAVIGACLVLGAGVGLFAAHNASSSDIARLAPAIGLLVAAAAAALGMVIAGAFRRRSGFFAFLTVTLLVLGLSAPALADNRSILLGDAYIGGTRSAEFVQPWGTLQIELRDTILMPAGDALDVVKGSGWTYVILYPGVELDLRGRFANVQLITQRGTWNSEALIAEERETVRSGQGELRELSRTFAATAAPGAEPVAPRTITLSLEQLAGDVTIMIVEPEPAPLTEGDSE